MHCCPNMHFLLNVMNNLKRLLIWARRWIRYVHVETSLSCYIKCLDHISCYFSAHHTVNYRHAHLMLLSSKFHTTLGNCSKCDTQTGGLPLLEFWSLYRDLQTESPKQIHKSTMNAPTDRVQLPYSISNSFWKQLCPGKSKPVSSRRYNVGPYKLPATLLLSFIISWAQDVCRWKLRTMEWSTTCPFYWVRCQVSPLGARIRTFHYTL
jgi:hypothetical protein